MKKIILTLYVKVDKKNSNGCVYVKIKHVNTSTTIGLNIWVNEECWKTTTHMKLTRVLLEQKFRMNLDKIINNLRQIEERLKKMSYPTVQTVSKKYFQMVVQIQFLIN